MENIVIQGIEGSFHHQVAQDYFGRDINLIKCNSFRELSQKIDGEKKYGVMAIENSIAGSILSNYNYLISNGLKVIGEYYLPIEHCLMTLPSQNIEDIKEVYSHPMAIFQCEEFFRQYPTIKLIETDDTAAAAKRISDNQTEKVAAIASQMASKLFRLNILSKGIQTVKNNFTRFFILSHSSVNQLEIQPNKISIKFSLKHESGMLADILNILRDRNINMTKIQSIPVIEKPWEYSFILDFLFNEKKGCDEVLEKIEKKTNDLIILGQYKKAKK